MSNDRLPVTRRGVLAASSTLAVASLAGCAAIDDYTNEDIKTGARLWLPLDHPSVEEYDSRTIDGSIATVSYRINILLYNDIDLEQTLEDRTAGGYTHSPARILGTIYIQTDGDGTRFTSSAAEQLRERLETVLREEMRNYGITDIAREETDDPVSREYRGVVVSEYVSDSDDVDDDALEEIPPIEMRCGFELGSDPDADANLRGSLWIQPTGTYEVKQIQTDGGDLLSVIASRGDDKGLGDGDDADADSLGDVTIEDELELSIGTMKISTNSQKPIRR
jgi:hypothetical protein